MGYGIRLHPVLAARVRVAVVCVVSACATALAGCGADDAGAGDPSEESTNPFRVEGPLTLLQLGEATADTCLGDYLLEDGQLQVTDCATAGAMPVVAATSFGESAPPEQPSATSIAEGASAVCGPLIDAWATAEDPGATAVHVMVYPDVWEGPTTPLICAARR